MGMHPGNGIGHVPRIQPTRQDHTLVVMLRDKVGRKAPVDGLPAPTKGSGNGGIEKEPRGFKTGV